MIQQHSASHNFLHKVWKFSRSTFAIPVLKLTRSDYSTQPHKLQHYTSVSVAHCELPQVPPSSSHPGLLQQKVHTLWKQDCENNVHKYCTYTYRSKLTIYLQVDDLLGEPDKRWHFSLILLTTTHRQWYMNGIGRAQGGIAAESQQSRGGKRVQERGTPPPMRSMDTKRL